MRQILLPTDFSENSWNAISYALQMFKDYECTFHLLNTYTPIIYHIEHVLGYPAQYGLGDAVRETSQENLKDFIYVIEREHPNPKHKFETYARFDSLISGIKEFMESHDIDLIVMGTKGATGAKEILLGSNTVHVLKQIKLPILAIPSDFKYEATHEILFPTDLEVDFKYIELRLLESIASSNQARLNVMHVSEKNKLTPKQEKNKHTLETLFKNSAYLYHNIRKMDVAEAINKFQVTHKINFLVMINNKHSFFENLFFKSTINQIGFHLNVPFLVIPSNQ